MSDNKLLDQSFAFAVAIIELVDSVKTPKSSYMTDQLVRAGTSIGAKQERLCFKVRDCIERI